MNKFFNGLRNGVVLAFIIWALSFFIVKLCFADTLDCSTRSNIVAGNAAAASDVKTCMDNITTWSSNITDTNIKTAAAIDPTKISGTAVTLSGAQTITGDKTITGALQGATPLIFEGATADTSETSLTVKDVTTDVTYNFQADASTTPGYIPVMTSEGTSGQFARSAGAGANPTWASIVNQNLKILATTRDQQGANGTENLSVGFTPKGVIAFGIDSHNAIFMGMATDDGTAKEVGMVVGAGAGVTSNNVINLRFSGAGQSAVVTTWASTTVITWTKTGSPDAGTATLLWFFIG